MAKGVKFKFEAQAKEAIAQFQQMNAMLKSLNNSIATLQAASKRSSKAITAELKNINTQLEATNARLNQMGKSKKKEQDKAKAIKNLALRFVGYNLVLNEAMNLQRRFIEYITDSVQKFREFEIRIAEVSTIMGSDFQDSIMGLQAGVESLAVQFGKDTSDMAKGLYDIMSAAFDAKEAIALLGTATRAAIAGLADVRESVDIFTTVLNTYGMSAYEASHVSDVLFQSVVRGKFQFHDLESALGYVVPIAAQAGISFEELMAALSTTTRHGLHLDMAARGLALAIQNIINPSAEAAKAAEEYGIQMDALTLRIKGLKGFFEELNEKAKEYGNTVINDLIPNMRSLRVAMVLAGDEGLEGLIDDMERLEVVSGRTEDALQKIVDTSQFVSKQITQKFEQEQRKVGKKWDELSLSGQRAITGFAEHWTYAIPVIGEFFRAFDKYNESALTTWKNETLAIYQNTEGKKNNLAVMKDYLQLQQQIQELSETVADKMEAGQDYSKDYEKLLFLQDLATNMQTAFDEAFGEPIMGGINKLKTYKDTLSEIEADIKRLKEELVEPITIGWGANRQVFRGSLQLQLAQLQMEQRRVDVTHDVEQALRDENYQWKTHNEELKAAVDVMREYEKQQEELKKKTREVNAEMTKLQIQQLEIQLKGMMRRRGLTRNEQKRLKKIQIEQAKLRLEQMKTEVESQDVSESVYEEKKEFVEDYINKIKEEEYQLNYTYDQEIQDLNTHLQSEKQLLEDRKQQWEDVNQAIIDTAGTLVGELKEILSDEELAKLFEDFGINIEEILSGIEGVKESAGRKKHKGGKKKKKPKDVMEDIATNPLIPKEIRKPFQALNDIADAVKGGALPGVRPLGGFARGTNYIPETGLYIMHRGEQVVPSGRDAGGDTYNININVKASVSNDVDISDLANKLGAAMQQKLVNKRTGRSNYRWR